MNAGVGLAGEALVSISDFSKMTYLSVKTLRHYHQVGLLTPAAVDPGTGYRRYRTGQVPTAQVIRRLRDLDMPVVAVKAVLHAPDVATRNELILGHLRQMQDQLHRTEAAVVSLQSLLEPATPTPAPIVVEYRTVDPIRVVAIRDRLPMTELDDWWAPAFAELQSLLGPVLRRVGPDGALYYPEFFEAGVGEVVAFIPVDSAHRDFRGRDSGTTRGRIETLSLPAAELAVTVHCGPFGELDRTYGALGSVVADRAIGVNGPIREHYLVGAAETTAEADHRTEVCWPVFQVRPEDTDHRP